MKKINVLLALFVAAIFVFSSCSDDEKSAPVITFANDIKDVTLDPGVTTFTLAGKIESEAGLQEVKFFRVVGGDETQLKLVTSFTDRNLYQFLEDITGLDHNQSIKVQATDRDNQTVSSTVNFIYTEPEDEDTPLAGAEDVTWQRVGGNAGTGLSQFGLKWTSNTASNAVISKDGATKFVQLSSSAWTDITTVEDLADAVEAATDMADYRGVSVTQANSTYTDVLATKYNDEYFMIRVESSSVSTGDAGTTITVSCKFKK